MKSVVVHRIALIMSVVLLLAGVVAYQYLHHSHKTDDSFSSLYTLVPADAFAVVETDDVTTFVDNFGGSSIADVATLPVSELLNSLKGYVHAFLEKMPHGLSPQVSKMLLSYHQPDGSRSQVLYCRVNSDDVILLQQFLDDTILSPSPEPEMMEYKGERIAVYQLTDGHSLAAYVADGFMALSFSMELLQKVIEAQQEKETLSEDSVFMDLQSSKPSFGGTSVFLQKNDRWEQVYL